MSTNSSTEPVEPGGIADNAIPGIAAGFRLQFEKQQDAWVLLYPEGMIKLNQSAGEILKRCDGARSVGQIIDELELAFEQPDLRDDVHAFMTIACQQKWLRLNES